MFEWNLKAIRKNKLSEKDGNSILGYCILKRRFFIITRERKFLNEVYVDNVKYNTRKTRCWQFERLVIPQGILFHFGII